MNKKVEYKTYGEYIVYLEEGYYSIKELQELVEETKKINGWLKSSLQQTEEDYKDN